MSLKVKAITAIGISIILVGLGILIWAYQTGKVTIFGSEQTSNVNYEVKGAELSKGTADANINLSDNKIELKKSGVSETGRARLDINKITYGESGQLASVPVSENFIGLYMVRELIAGNLFNSIQNYESYLNSGGYQMKWITDKEAVIQTSVVGVQVTIDKVNPEIKFYTANTGQFVGEMFLEINGHKEKYLGVTLVRSHTASPLDGPEELYVVASSYVPSNPSKINTYSYKLGEVDSNGTQNWANWYNEKIAAWLPNKAFKVVVAKSIDGENIGTPHLLWQGKDSGEYLGYTRVERPIVKTQWDNTTVLEEGILTGTGLIKTGNTCGFNYAQNTEDTYNCQNLSVLLTNSPEVFVQTNAANQGIYTYSTGSQNVIKYNTFEPINPVTPDTSKITYRFAGSTDNQNWSNLSEAIEAISTVDLSKYIPSDSKFFKTEITLTRGTTSPTLDGFKLNYDANGIVPDNTNPADSGNTADSTSTTASLVSTGASLWFNILIALIIGGLITWLMLRKSK